jgi:DNA-binding transcriptional LysR family regulator
VRHHAATFRFERLAPRIEGDFIASRLLRTRYRVCVSPGYLAEAPRLVTPSDLSAHRCLVSALPEFRSRWKFQDDSGDTTEISVTGDLATTNAIALRDCAIAAMGPALLADWLVDADLRSGRLVDVFPGYRVTATNFDTGVWIVYPSREWLPKKVRTTIDFFRNHLA